MATWQWMAVAAALCGATAHTGRAAPVVPGAGVVVNRVGDDFEDAAWGYVMNGAKASHEQDEQQRPPGGRSRNGRWYEGAKRGQPDVIRRIATPPGGLPGSAASLMVATKFSGIPGTTSGKQMQDDLLMGIETRLGRPIPTSWTPSVVVRVYLPEFSRWEQRSGSSFGVRADVSGRNPDGEVEPYWPGMFLLFRSAAGGRHNHDYAEVSIRARENGKDVKGPVIEAPGWWTFGLSFTPDGMIHQYASPGVDDLAPADHLLSSRPYGSQCLYLNNFFVNVANLDNGRNWSTPWVIDDPTVYVVPPGGQVVDNLMRGRSSVAARSGGLSGRGGGARR